jgi:hypothetical protein
MPLSRLDNFLKNVRGNILYVDPSNLDATDGIENQGNSLARPFKTLQRALIEASRFSYQRGLDNDRFEKTSIYLLPGDHFIDNRPGWIPTGTSGSPNTFLLRNGQTSTDFPSFSNTTNFGILDSNNILYRFNSIYGGVIVPRGVSIVGQDLRKTKIRPLYVPNPQNDLIERSAIFRVTGACYFFQFSVFDASTSRGVYKDYTTNTFTPSFSHHKLTAFEYADGKNSVNINDEFNTFSTSRTDLDMYYEKIGRAYGPASGREISPDYPNAGVDINPKIDEYRIVGPISGSVGISSIKAGDGNTPTSTVNVKLNNGITGLNVDTNVIINSVTDSRYNGTYLVKSILDTDANGVTEFTYDVPVPPSNALPNPLGSSIELSTDTVSSASPYIFNISMRSIYGMCGMHADGSKANGFKSMVVAQFTGISLQVDDQAFVKYNATSGTFDDSNTIPNLHTDINAVFKPDYENYHIKASNNAFIQLVSIFAIGYSDHFVVESGGDFSVTNSNSNFGQRALRSDGYRPNTFSQDDVGYITHIAPPRSLLPRTVTVEYPAIDITKTVGVGQTHKLYLYDYTNQGSPPPSELQGYRFGAHSNDTINVILSTGGVPTQRSAKICMEDTADTSKLSGVKRSRVGNNVSTGNSISNSTLNFTQNHDFLQGESVRVISSNGRLPDGLDENRPYFAIVDGLAANQIQLAQSFNDSLNGNKIRLNNLGGTITVESRVNDKISGQIGHPIQYDETEGQWYVNVSTAATENNIYSTIEGGGYGTATPRTYILRQPDNRSSNDRVYKFRYVIPSNIGVSSARPPLDGFILQESSTVTGRNNTEVQLEFNPVSVTMSNDAQMRNFSFIANTTYSNGIAYYDTERPHGLSIGSTVEINGVRSTLFPTVGAGNSGYNGVYEVTGISSAKTFSVDQIPSNPGIFLNNTSQRNTSLPTFRRKSFTKNLYVYDVNTINEYVSGEQDGIYYITVLDSSKHPLISPFNQKKYSFSQPLANYYPQLDRDNPVSSPKSSTSYALANDLGKVVIDEPKSSITAETLEEFISDGGIGIGITDIISNPVGTAYTIYTDHDHGLNPITIPTIDNGGAGYGDGTSTIQYYYNAKLINIGAGSLGRNATARVTVDGTSSGEIIDIQIMDGGSSFVEGDLCRIAGIATTTGFSPATISVNKIYDNRGDTLRVSGINDYDGRKYNKLYRISAVTDINKIEVTPVGESPGISTLGLGRNVSAPGSLYLTGSTLNVTNFEYNNVTGLATVTTQQNNNIRVNNAIQIDNADSSLYNGIFVCRDKVGLSTLIIDIGISTDIPVTTGNIRIHPIGFQENYGELVTGDGELNGRETHIYAGITTITSAAITSKTTDTINVENMINFGFLIGDYIKINDEIMRIKTTVSRVSGTTQLKVFRGVYGSIANTHPVGSVVTRIKFYPLEFRRNSIIRASGHTFEYIGFGPGNYSTAFPDKQTKRLTLPQQISAQALKTNGGVVNYTGMNDRGDFFIGNKRIASNTGREQVYDTPVQTVSGEDPFSSQGVVDTSNFNYIEGSTIKVERNLVVDGGDRGSIISEFNAPVSFTKKVTISGNDGIETNNLFLQGNVQVSRKLTVGISTPILSGNPGDVVFNANPTNGGTVGWVYTTNNEWREFGSIS